MNITITAFGSRGDIQPFLALAVALRERGHTVTLIVPSDFEALVKTYAIPFVRIPISTTEFMERDFGKRLAQEGVTPSTLLLLWRELIPEVRRALRETAQILAETAQNSDLLIAHGFLIPFAYAIHQQLQIPLMLGIAAPILATREFPSAMFPPLPIGGRFYNPHTYDWLVRFVIFFMMKPMNEYRQSVGLPKLATGVVIRLLTQAQFPVLLHYSRHLSPAPADWNANAHLVGAWSLPRPADWTPPARLSAFLEQGEPPVYIGFGSMPAPQQISQTISEALRLANLRGVLQAGWAGLEHEAEHLITIGDTPHDWLFPRMAAIVHHGGSGTTHSALLAGKPALIVPFNADQPFWGRQIAQLGVGVPPITRKKLTVERLAAALRTLTQDSAMQQRAAAMGALLRAEAGLVTACELVEQYANPSQ